MKSNQETQSGNRPLIFIHIPKTGGSTMGQILDRRHDREQIAVYSGVEQVRGDFFHLAAEKQARLRLVRGHMPFGMHEVFAGPVDYMTMFRHPVERVLSLYYHAAGRQDPGNYLHDRVGGAGLSLGEFLEGRVTVEMDNLQTRMLAGWTDCYETGFGECTEAMLERALSNLRRLTVFGLTERFDESVLLAHKLLGWDGPPGYVSVNVTAGKPWRGSVHPGAIETIKRYNALDLRLYAAAETLFARALRRVNIHASDVAIYKMMNCGYRSRVKLAVWFSRVGAFAGRRIRHPWTALRAVRRKQAADRPIF
jgi:hypothetical protein